MPTISNGYLEISVRKIYETPGRIAAFFISAPLNFGTLFDSLELIIRV